MGIPDWLSWLVSDWDLPLPEGTSMGKLNDWQKKVYDREADSTIAAVEAEVDAQINLHTKEQIVEVPAVAFAFDDWDPSYTAKMQNYGDVNIWNGAWNGLLGDDEFEGQLLSIWAKPALAR